MTQNLPILHIVGAKNSGKTVLLEWLVRSLSDRGIKVGALKHSMHDHPVDKPHSDSDRLRAAGADAAAFWSDQGLGIYFPPVKTEQGWQIVKTVFADFDLVLVESFGSAPNPKIFIDDGSNGWQNFNNVIALVSQRVIQADLPVFTKNDPALISFILDFFKLNK